MGDDEDKQPVGLSGDQYEYVEKIWIKCNRDAAREVDQDELTTILDKVGYEDPHNILHALFSHWDVYKGEYGITLDSFKKFIYGQAKVNPRGVQEWVNVHAEALRLDNRPPGQVRLKKYISGEEFDEFYNRQVRTRRKFEKWKAGLKMDLLTEELERLQPAPTISNRSRWIARDMQPLSERVYTVIAEHDVLMRNVAHVAKQSEMMREQGDCWQAPKAVTHEQAEISARALIKRGQDAAQRREMAQRTKEMQEMAAVTDKPRISSRSKQLALARQEHIQGVSAFERLANDHTAVSSQKQSAVKHKPHRARPASARSVRRTAPPFGSTGSRELDPFPVKSPPKGKTNQTAVLACERMYRKGLQKRQAREAHVLNELRARGIENPEDLVATGGQGVYRVWQR